MSPYFIHHHFQSYTETTVADWMTAFGTVFAVAAAIVTPWVVNYLNYKPKKSKFVFEKCSVINQDPASSEDDKNSLRLLHVGRLVVKNIGRHKAVAAEAFIEKVVSNGDVRKNFIPMPLVWTHGRLSKTGPIVRDIYPNQTVYLDIFNHIYDYSYAGNSNVVFTVAAGHNNDNLSQMNSGESELFIKIYQESGQVDDVIIKSNYDGKNCPEISILKS